MPAADDAAALSAAFEARYSRLKVCTVFCVCARVRWRVCACECLRVCVRFRCSAGGHASPAVAAPGVGWGGGVRRGDGCAAAGQLPLAWHAAAVWQQRGGMPARHVRA
jgi:hypothetical protein